MSVGPTRVLLSEGWLVDHRDGSRVPVDGHTLWSVAEQGPEWLILHHPKERGPAHFARSYTVEDHRYRLEKVFDSVILSGWQWYCYRREPRRVLAAPAEPGIG